MSEQSLYRKYLAADAALKRLAAVGLEGPYAVNLGTESSFWRGRLEYDLEHEQGGPNLYRFGEIQVWADFAGPNFYLMTDDEAQETREERINEFLRRFPDARVAQHEGNTSVYFEPLDGLGVTLNAGRAFCQLVQVDTREVTRKDPELSAKLLEALPEVTVEEPVMAWRCNDAPITL